MNYLISKLYSFANVEWLHLSSSNYDMQVLRTSCWVPLRVLLHSTDGILKLTFSTGILSCRRDELRHFNSVNSSFTYVFHLADFVDISYLTHFAITSLVTFAALYFALL